MNKPINANCCSCSCSIKDMYPSFLVTITKIEIVYDSPYCKVIINDNKVIAVVRKGIANLLRPSGLAYRIWFDYGGDDDVDINGAVRILFFERVS